MKKKIEQPEVAEEELLILERLKTLQDHMKETELITIRSLMWKGVSLAEIGRAMGITRQALRKRLMGNYYGKDLDLPTSYSRDPCSKVSSEQEQDRLHGGSS